MQIKLNVNIGNYKAGTVLKLDAKDNVPTDQFWRKRLKDAQNDNCVEIINKTTENKKTKQLKKSEKDSEKNNIEKTDKE